MRSFEALLHPARERVHRAKGRDAFVLHGGEHGAANQDLATGVAFAFGVIRSCDETGTFGAQASKASVE
ncbi:MAG: hypothetical protein ABMA15_02605 [Vicinamibacterales bacterium]